MPNDLELVDRRILNVIQSAFPLVPEPYRAIGEEAGIPPQEVIRRIREMKQQNVVRQVSAIFDTRRLGYKTSLVAMRVPPESLEKAARRINLHPGVSHNYARDGYFNLWFTLAVPPSESLEAAVERMARETEAEATRIMPTIRLFKIGVNFDMVAGRGAAYDYYSPDGHSGDGTQDWNRAEPLTEFEIQLIRELQEDLPLEPRPFDAMAQRLEISVQELFDRAADLKRRGVMRRFGAVLHHRSAGFNANAMVVWRVPGERSQEVGQIMAAHPAVSHCYERPTFPDWPYSHFTMVHAATKGGCEEVAREISRKTGITDYQPLYSTREYKKTRVRYFV